MNDGTYDMMIVGKCKENLIEDIVVEDPSATLQDCLDSCNDVSQIHSLRQKDGSLRKFINRTRFQSCFSPFIHRSVSLGLFLRDQNTMWVIRGCMKKESDKKCNFELVFHVFLDIFFLTSIEHFGTQVF